MERVHLLLVLLAGMMPQVWCQIIDISSVNVTITGQTGVYIEGETNHEFTFDVAISVGGTVGADDPAVDRWGLVVSLLTTETVPTTIATSSLTYGNGGLTAAQADLVIKTGETGVMVGVKWSNVDLSAQLCPTLADAQNMNYVLQVELVEGAKVPATSYALTKGGVARGPTNPIEDDAPPSLTCRGVVVHIVPQIVTQRIPDTLPPSLPIVERTVHEMEINVIISSESQSRDITGATPAEQLWDLVYTLRKDGVVVETATTTDDSDQTQDLLASSTITINNGVVTFNLQDDIPVGTYGTTCDEFDELCVELSRDAGATTQFSFTGGDTESCVSVACNGILITDVVLATIEQEELCQGTDDTNAMNMDVDLTLTVKLDERSAPLTIGNLDPALDADPTTNPANADDDFWAVNVHGSMNADCTGDRVKAVSAQFQSEFHDMSPGQANLLPLIKASFDLREVGCQQVKYICAQLYRIDNTISNDDFTYGFINPHVSSVGITGPFPNTVIDTAPAANNSQWGSVEVKCKGVELDGVSLVLNGQNQNLGEYTRSHRVDFTVTYNEIGDCLVRGTNLWQLEAFLTSGAAITGAIIPDGSLADANKYAHVLLSTPVNFTQGQESQNIDVQGESLTFNSWVNFDLSDLDCQQGPFHMCVLLSKHPANMNGFVLENVVTLNQYIVCGPVHPCVGVDLESIEVTEGNSNNKFPLRQGVNDIPYGIDVTLRSSELAGSIIPNPVTPFEVAPTDADAVDLWDMDFFLSTTPNPDTNDQIAPVWSMSDRCDTNDDNRELQERELQAGDTTTFQNVRASLDLTNIQCHEFEYLCVTVKHGATHDQSGQTHGTDTKRAPTLEPISTTLTGGTCTAGIPDIYPDTAFDCTAGPDPFCVPSPRLDSAKTDCVAVACRGVEIEEISCAVQSSLPVHPSFAAPDAADGVLLSSDIRSGQKGYFHLSVNVEPVLTAGGVRGRDLWKMAVFLSPNRDGSVETVSSPVDAISVAGVNANEDETVSPPVVDWEDADLLPSSELQLDVWTSTTELFDLVYPCAEMRFLCIKFEKGDSPLVGDGDTDFTMTPLSEPHCKELNTCGDVILDNVVLTLDPADQVVIEKQDSDPADTNKLTIDVDLQFSEASANFEDGIRFWDIDVFIATNDQGTDGIQQNKNGVFQDLDGAVVGFGESQVTDRTTTINLDNGDDINPEFDLTGTTCLDPDTDNAYLYLCVSVTKSDTSAKEFTLTPTQTTTCIRIKCEGLVFDTPILDPVSGGPVLEVTANNELRISQVEFPLMKNGARTSDFNQEIWGVTFFLASNADGSGDRIAEVEAELEQQEAEDGVSFGSPLRFNNKDAVLSMEGALCPAGIMYICAELEEIVESGCSIDTSAAVVCRNMTCKGVEFSTIDFTLDPVDTCLVEHNENNPVQFEFNAGTVPGTASVQGTNLWLVTVYGSFNPDGLGVLRYGEAVGVASQSTSLTAGSPFTLSAVTAELDLSDFVCTEDNSNINLPLFLCVQLERNSEQADPIFSVTYNPDPLVKCKTIECKGVKINVIRSVGPPPSALVERSGPTEVTCSLEITTDAKYASNEGINLWEFTAELRDEIGAVVVSEEVDLTQEQRNQGLDAGDTVTFEDLTVTFDMDRNTRCPDSGTFDLCLVIKRGGGRSPDFTIDQTSVTEVCKLITCRGVCIQDNSAAAITGSGFPPLQEGNQIQMVWLDVEFESDPTHAGIDDDIDARDLWEVDVFASPSRSGGARFALTAGELGTNNENRPLPAGNALELRVHASLDFAPNDYLTCNNMRYICVELKSNPASNPPFSLDGCPVAQLVACAEFECQGVLIERVSIPNPAFATIRENKQEYMVNFDLTLTPNEDTSVLNDGDGVNSLNYWGVEIFGSAVDSSGLNLPSTRSAVTIVNIPTSEGLEGVQKPGVNYDPADDTTLSGLSATMDLTGAYCSNLQYLCARLLRGSAAQPPFRLSGLDGEGSLIGCVPVTCEGVEVTSASIKSLEPTPACVSEGNPSLEFEYDAEFETSGGGVFGSNLWQIATFMSSTADGTSVLDVNGDSLEDVSYSILTGGQESQTLDADQELGFQNVQARFDTRGLVCPAPPAEVYFCIRLEKDEEDSSSAFTLNSPENARTDCMMVECKGLELTLMDFDTAQTTITERQPNQDFEIDIIAETNPDAGSVSGTNLWTVNVFFNSQEDGQGAVFGNNVTADLEIDNANRAVSAGDNLVLNDVEVDLSAANVLCNSGDVYLCVQIKRNTTSDPAFTLIGDTLKCKLITCNSVLITSALFAINSPEYLIENTENSVNFRVGLVSSNVSAAIEGSNLWSMDRVFSSDNEMGTGTPVVEEAYELLSQEQRDRDLLPGETLSLSDVKLTLDLTENGVTCENIDYLCAMFDKSDNPAPEFTLVFQGEYAPPWCADVTCRGVEVLETRLNIGTAAVSERTTDTDIIFDVHILSEGAAAGVEGDDLWKLTAGFQDENGVAIPNSVVVPVNLGSAPQTLTPGQPLMFTNLQDVDVALGDVICPDGELFFCVWLAKADAPDNDFTLTGVTDDALYDCQPIKCRGVQFTDTSIEITGGRLISETAASQNHNILFGFDATSALSTTTVSGFDLWAVNVFGSRNDDGSGRRFKERKLALSQTQADQDLNTPGQVLPFSSLAAIIDMRGVFCVDFQYFCAEIAREDAETLTPDFSVQGVNSTGYRDDDRLIACQSMQCIGAYITIFDATPQTPIILIENRDNQVYNFDAFLESDADQESVEGVNLWAMRSYFNPQADCQGVDENGDLIRVAETPAELFASDPNQNLVAGDSIDFRNARLSIDYDGTCEIFEEETFLCIEVIRNPQANPIFTLLGNTLIGLPSECRGVQIIDTNIIGASWQPNPFIENANAAGRKRRETQTLTFDLDILADTSINAAGVIGSDLWKISVYLSGDESCLTYDESTHVIVNSLSNPEQDQDLYAGQTLSFNVDSVVIPANDVLCRNARYVCARIHKGDAPSNDFTLTGIPDESSLIGAYETDCRGVRLVESELRLSTGVPLISGERNHQIVFSFTIKTDYRGASISGTDLFTLYIYGNSDENGFGTIPGNGYVVPIQQPVSVYNGTENSFDYLPASLNLVGVSCSQVPYVCAQIYKGSDPRPDFTLQPYDPLDGVYTDCVRVPCTGVVIEELSLEFTRGLPLLEDARAHELDFFIRTTASEFGGDAIGDDLWAAEIFISRYQDGSGEQTARESVLIVNPGENLVRGETIDLLSTVVLDLDGVVCLNVQYICVDLWKGDNPIPDFTLEGISRTCQGFTCKGVDFLNPGLLVHTDVVLGEGTPQTHVAFDAFVDADRNSASVQGDNLFKISVFASSSLIGGGPRYGEDYANLAYAYSGDGDEIKIVANQRTYINNGSAYLDLSGVYCQNLNYLCIEIWKGDHANPTYQIDNPVDQSGLRACQQVVCAGVEIESVMPELVIGSPPVIEDRENSNTWINIHFEPTDRSASIIGDNLWEATCFVNSEENGSGTKYSLQTAYLEESERNKDLIRGTDYVILENAIVVNDYSGRQCDEIRYICCTIDEADGANPDFNLRGAYGNSQLLTGCVESFCLGVGITSTRLRLDSLEIIRGDNAHTFEGDLDFNIWHESRQLQEDDTWALTALLLDQDKNTIGITEVELLQEQQDRAVVPGTVVTFEDISFQFDLSVYECYQIAYVCVGVSTQEGVGFELAGVTDTGEEDMDAVIGCSPRLECGDFGVDIEVRATGERFIEIGWTEAEGDFDTYVITYEPEESIVASPQNIPRHLRTPLRFDGLTPGEEYIFSVYLYKGNTLKAGPVVEVERTTPATVEVTINRNTNSELYVQWTQAAGVYDTYIVELDPQGTPPTPIYVDALAPRELIFSGLREAIFYTVMVYTVVGGRNGYQSAPGYASETTRPAPPFLQLDEGDTGVTWVDLSWIAPTSYPVAGYSLRSEPEDDVSNIPVELLPELRSFRVTGLTPGRLYDFHLQAFARVEGDNVYSMDSSVTTRTYPASVPGIVNENANTNSITFEWDEPEGDVDSYLISYDEQAGPPEQRSALLPRRFTASPLGLATTHEFTIVTVSGGLESEPFVFRAATRPNRPGPIRTLEVGKDFVEVQWDIAPGPLDGYEVSYEPTHEDYLPASPYFTTENSFELQNIHPHTTIEFMVRTVKDGTRSDPVTWRQRTFPDLPGEVDDFEVDVYSPNSVVLRFSQPEYPNGLITAYIIRYEGSKPGNLGIDSGLQTITALPNDFDFEETLIGLRSGYTYSFEIQATNSEGSGPAVSVDGVTLTAGRPILAITPEALQSNYFSQLKTTAYTIENVPIREEFFSDANGDIIGYAVLVVQDSASDYNSTQPIPKSYQQIRDYDVWPVYQTSEILGRYEFQGRKKRQTYFDYYTVGTEENCGDGYCNGELRPLTAYRVLIRAYTEAYTEDGYMDTPWSDPVTTSADRWWFAYAAIPFLVIVLLLAIILALCACSAGEKKVERRRRYRKGDYHNGGYSRDDYGPDDFTDYGAEVYNENANANPVYLIPSEADSPIPGPGTLQSKLNPTHVLGSRPIQISKFQQHIASMAANNAIKFVEEYENLRPVGDDLARLIGGLPENKNKNRFSNIMPYDYNRVTMADDSYINASFIGGFNSRHEYIATQGPLPNSVDTFWSMVWENNCPTIVMMGRCIEDGHVKSEKYWPDNDVPVTYGNLTITMVTEKTDDDWTVRDFTIQSGSEIRAVRQLNFTSWPNHGVPEQTDGLIRFVSTVRAEAPQHSGPMVIHCGAGIGRTSTFLALDILMQGLVYDESTVDVCGTVSSLRKQRCCMVQTVHQYIFLHKAMLDILQGKVSGYNWLLRTRKGSIGSLDSDQKASDDL